MSKFLQVIIPDSGRSLLRQEIALGFASLGLSVLRVAPEHLHNEAHRDFLPNLLKKPSLLLAVNADGLAPYKNTLEYLEKSHSAACIWCVDNPWNILSGVREPLWKEVPFFVTDKSFIPALQENGAKKVEHLPLGACFASFKVTGYDSSYLPISFAPFAFVGRSQFPGKEKFFSNLAIPETEWQIAKSMLQAGQRPDLLWWQEKLHVHTAKLWPGKVARLSAFCAEEASLLWRQTALEFTAQIGATLCEKKSSATHIGLDIFGDAGWEKFLPTSTRLLPPVDYYRHLPNIYSGARFNIALTSLQLPHAVNQRHFDIWAAGGLCLSDSTRGLDIFPTDLVEQIVFTDKQSLEKKVEALIDDRKREELIKNWQVELANNHTYMHRLKTLLAFWD